MKDNLKDILSNLNPDIDQETLLSYLQGKLSAEKQHELEMQMLESDFEADAIEGLQNMPSPQNVPNLVEQLNRDLRKRTAQKKSRRDKLRLKSDPWIWVAILITLLLIVISYLIIHQYLKV